MAPDRRMLCATWREVVTMDSGTHDSVDLGQLVRRRDPSARAGPWGLIVGLVFAERAEALVRWQGSQGSTFELVEDLVDAIQ